MMRVEENKMVIERMIEEEAKRTPNEKVMSFQLSAIASMLADISKSLAVIADKVESEDV